MEAYLGPIKDAIILFPIIAFLITIPYMIFHYHKYGSISKYRTIIIYSFILYLICAYCLIVLPLPSFDYVSKLTTARTQLIPFNFIGTFFSESGFVLSNFSTYIPALKHASFYQVAYNLVLLLPLGVYLRYYFKCSFKKTLFITFGVSLFFELTQLSGLYFVYPRGYRLFDVDDLIINTLGGVLGYLFVSPFMKLLPTRDSIDEKAFVTGKKVSGIRRILAFSIDFILCMITYILVVSLMSVISFRSTLDSLIFLTFFMIIPILTRGFSVGKALVKIRICGEDGSKASTLQILLRCVFIYLLLYAPLLIRLPIYFEFIFLLFILVFYSYLFIQLLRGKSLFYEKWTKTKLVSVIPIKGEK